MYRFKTEPIVLSYKQANFLYMPDNEHIANRNAIFAKMDAEISIKRNGMDIEVDIPGLDLSFIK